MTAVNPTTGAITYNPGDKFIGGTSSEKDSSGNYTMPQYRNDIVNYNPNGAPTMNVLTGYSPTVVSSSTVHDTTIPGITQNANNNVSALTPTTTGTTGAGGTGGSTGNTGGSTGGTGGGNTGGTGGTDYSNMSYGDIYKSVYGDTSNAAFSNPQLQSEMNLIQQAGQGADAATRASLAAVQAQYQNEYANTVQTQGSTTAGVEQSLNLGGSSRYAPVSSAGILDSKTRYDLQTLQGLSAANASNVAKLQQAIADNDFKTAQSMNDLIDKTRIQSQTLAASIASGIASQAKDTRDKLQTAVSDAASSAQKNGAPASVIQAIQNAKTPADAYAAAAGYGGGANIDVQKITNVDGSSSIVRVDKNTGKIIGTTNIGGTDNTTGNGGSALTPNDYKDFITGLTPAGASNFNKLSSTDQSSVKQLLSGDALLSDLFTSRGAAGSALRQQILQKAQSVDPTFSENTNKQRYTFMQQWNNPNGKQGVTRNAINTALGHLADTKQSSDALDNEGLKIVNSVSNWWGAQTSNPSVLKLQTDLNALSSEVATTYKGATPTEDEIKNWNAVLGADFTKGGMTSVLNEVSKLLTSKITASRYQYQTTMGKPLSTSIIDPDKKQGLIDAGIDPSVIAHENIPGEAKTGVVGFIDSATGSVDPTTGQKYTPEAIVNYIATKFPDHANAIQSTLGKPDSTGHIVTAQDIINYLNQ